MYCTPEPLRWRVEWFVAVGDQVKSGGGGRLRFGKWLTAEFDWPIFHTSYALAELGVSEQKTALLPQEQTANT